MTEQNDERKEDGMTRKMAWQTREIYNGYQPTNRLELKGPVVEEDEDGWVTWEPERLFCAATWTDGRTIYSVERREDGRFRWAVTEFALDPEDDWSRHREGDEDTYAEACSHLSAFVTDPDHVEEVGFFVYEEEGEKGDFEDIDKDFEDIEF